MIPKLLLVVFIQGGLSIQGYRDTGRALSIQGYREGSLPNKCATCIDAERLKPTPDRQEQACSNQRSTHSKCVSGRPIMQTCMHSDGLDSDVCWGPVNKKQVVAADCKRRTSCLLALLGAADTSPCMDWSVTDRVSVPVCYPAKACTIIFQTLFAIACNLHRPSVLTTHSPLTCAIQ